MKSPFCPTVILSCRLAWQPTCPERLCAKPLTSPEIGRISCLHKTILQKPQATVFFVIFCLAYHSSINNNGIWLFIDECRKAIKTPKKMFCQKPILSLNSSRKFAVSSTSCVSKPFSVMTSIHPSQADHMLMRVAFLNPIYFFLARFLAESEA